MDGARAQHGNHAACRTSFCRSRVSVADTASFTFRPNVDISRADATTASVNGFCLSNIGPRDDNSLSAVVERVSTLAMVVSVPSANAFAAVTDGCNGHTTNAQRPVTSNARMAARNHARPQRKNA